MTITPMMKQYYDIKMAHEDAIVFFRLGDFYEMFYEDAYKASRILGLTLTSRGKDENGHKIPMCGIPHHSANTYIPKLLAHNIKIAICEQTEDPSLSKGITRREVVNILTPGTLLEDNYLSSGLNNFLMAVTLDPTKPCYGLAYCDISTGEFWVTELATTVELLDELEKIDPREVLVPPQIEADLLKGRYITPVTICSTRESEKILGDYFNLFSLEGLGLESFHSGIQALACITVYLNKTRKSKNLLRQRYKSINTWELGPSPFAIGSHYPHESAHKIGIITLGNGPNQNPMGTRLLRKWLIRPLYDLALIRQRLDAVDFFYQNQTVLHFVLRILETVYDIERLNTRLLNGLAHPKDLVSIKQSLVQLPEIYQHLYRAGKAFHELVLFPESWLDNTQSLVNSIATTLIDEPPALLSSGGFIRSGTFPELDALRAQVAEGKNWFVNYEEKLRQETGIKSLKISTIGSLDTSRSPAPILRSTFSFANKPWPMERFTQRNSRPRKTLFFMQ